MYLDKESNVWIPELKLKNGKAAWDWINFYKDFYEGPIPLSWAGNWDGTFKINLSQSPFFPGGGDGVCK